MTEVSLIILFHTKDMSDISDTDDTSDMNGCIPSGKLI